MKRRSTITILLVTVALALVLSACGRANLNRRGVNNSAPPQSQPTSQMLPTLAQAATQASQIATAVPQVEAAATTAATASTEITNDVDAASQQIDALINDLNTTDTMSDFK